MKIKYVSEQAPTGYGRAARGYIRALQMSGAELTWTPMLVGDRWGKYLEPFLGTDLDDEFAGLCNRPLEYDLVVVQLLGDYFPRWRSVEPGKKLIGITVWETDQLDEVAVAKLSQVDGMIVPCRWNERTFRNGGVTVPIHVAPHIHFESNAPSASLDLPEIADSDCVFYAIGDWRERKGMHLTVESFCRAFTGKDPVALVIKTGPVDERRRVPGHWWWHIGRRFLTPRRAVAQILAKHRDPPKVVLVTGEVPAGRIQAIHRRGDCYASLARAEGWGLGAYEAAFAGKPVIMTGHGGQLDFLPASLSYHVDFQLIPARPTGESEMGFQGHLWADPDLDHGARQMREVFSSRKQAQQRGQALRAFVKERFDPLRIAAGMMDFAASLK